MKKIKLFLIASVLFCLSSCFNKPAFRFTNFYGTPAEKIAKAIKRNDVDIIRNEVVNHHINVNYKDKKYEVSLLVLALTNNKKPAFNELLKLGADPNIKSSDCVSPLICAIRYNKNCDLYYVNELLKYDAAITPEFFKQCGVFSSDPICETITIYNEKSTIKCGLQILKKLTDKLNDPNLLFRYNNAKNYRENIIYHCLSSSKNLAALKYLIVDLKYKVPKEIYIDGTVQEYFTKGFNSLTNILKSEDFKFKSEDLNSIKNEIIDYLNTYHYD
ncbi:hypothetical protein ACG2LH_02690 [Zhouia sp. PK063]|uniref:hypothetical protein n=1 Tax=Zhouia sp. PK063 TaxID=3373602 RepID=UPI0037BBBC92